MTQPAVIGVDLGTTGVKAALFTPDGIRLGQGAAGYPMSHPSPGAAEQDPDLWWTGLVAAVRGATANLDVAVRAITVVGQGPTLVAVDDTGRVVRPAICWMDTRAHAHQVALSGSLELDGFLLGNLPKIAWMEAEEPELSARTRWYLSAWDYLAMRLGADPVTAMPPTKSQATPEMAGRAGLDATRVPPLADWGTGLGHVSPDAAGELDVPETCLVVAGGNDALSSYVGSGISAPGEAINNGGTSGGFAVYWHDGMSIPGVYSIPAVVSGLRLFGGAMSATGLSLDWLAGITGDRADLLSDAASVEPGAGGLVYLPYLLGERSPLWDANARGAFFGLSADHRRGHLGRAVLEASGYAIRHVAEPILAAGVEVAEMRACGGSAVSDLWNQIKADVTGFVVAVPDTVETAALGAAILGSIGIGQRADLREAMDSMVHIARRLEPDAGAASRYDELYGIYRGLYPALKDSFDRLAAYRARR